MPTIDEFGAAERWKLQPKPIRQQTQNNSKFKNQKSKLKIAKTAAR